MNANNDIKILNVVDDVCRTKGYMINYIYMFYNQLGKLIQEAWNMIVTDGI